MVFCLCLCRRVIVLKKDTLSMYMDELRLSELILSYSAKSEQAWSHRYFLVFHLVVASFLVLSLVDCVVLLANQRYLHGIQDYFSRLHILIKLIPFFSSFVITDAY